ncbi:MAG: hypothetical protein WA809_03205 [Candidatus Dormiibacterota bacterium]
MTDSSPRSDAELTKGPRRLGHYRWAAAATVVVLLAAASAIFLVTRPVGPTTRRANFLTMEQTLRSDLADCNAKASAAISWWTPAVVPTGWMTRAKRAAQSAVYACSPDSSTAIFQLTLYSLPSALSGLHLNYAVSALGVWAQEDVAPAMRSEKTLLARPGDKAAVTAILRQAGWAAENLSAANSTLRHAARKLGFTHFTPIRLTSIQPGARLYPPR